MDLLALHHVAFGVHIPHFLDPTTWLSTADGASAMCMYSGTGITALARRLRRRDTR